TSLRVENRVFPVAPVWGIRVTDVSVRAVAGPAGPVIPAAGVLRDVPADGSLIADLRRSHRFGGPGEEAVFLLNESLARHICQRRHGADLDAVRCTAHSLEFRNATQIDQRLRLSHPVLEPVEAVETASQDPAVRALLFEKLLCVGQRAWLQ